MAPKLVGHGINPSSSDEERSCLRPSPGSSRLGGESCCLWPSSRLPLNHTGHTPELRPELTDALLDPAVVRLFDARHQSAAGEQTRLPRIGRLDVLLGLGGDRKEGGREQGGQVRTD